MDKHKVHQNDVISIIDNSSSTDGRLKRKKLFRKIIKKFPHSSDEEIDSLINYMVSSDILKRYKEKDNYFYSITCTSAKTKIGEFDSDRLSKTETETHIDMKRNQSRQEESLPFAELMRRKKQLNNDGSKSVPLKRKEDNNIDDEIKRLEAELAEDESSDDNNDDYDDNSAVKGSVYSLNDEKNNNGIISFSSIAEERIPSLPQSALPLLQKSKRLKVDREMDDDQPKKKPKKTTAVSNGLKDAVREMLGNYVARSSEKLPFYCRVCSKQLTSYEEFRDHQKTEFHKVAVQEEQKASYCRLCRKQFTSPAQLKEHIKARPHKEKLAYERAKQSQRKASHNRSIGSNEFSKSSGSRQWC